MSFYICNLKFYLFSKCNVEIKGCCNKILNHMLLKKEEKVYYMYRINKCHFLVMNFYIYTLCSIL